MQSTQQNWQDLVTGFLYEISGDHLSCIACQPPRGCTDCAATLSHAYKKDRRTSQCIMESQRRHAANKRTERIALLSFSSPQSGYGPETQTRPRRRTCEATRINVWNLAEQTQHRVAARQYCSTNNRAGLASTGAVRWPVRSADILSPLAQQSCWVCR